MSRLPLEGVRIVDLTVVWIGPFAAQMLADWGAEVIRLEPLQIFQPWTRGPRARPVMGGVSGYTSSFPDDDPGERPWNRNVTFQIHGRNKLSATGFLSSPECMDLFLRLVNISDIVLENNVPQTLDKLGISYERLKKSRPDIIMVRVPGFGSTGPYAHHRAFGSHMEALVGHTSIRGYPDLPPPARGTTYLADAIGGFTGAYAALAALYHRKETGKGQLVEAVTSEVMLHYFAEAVMDCGMNGRVHSPIGNRDTSMAPQGCYPCKGEDGWVVMSVGSDEEWEALRRAMGDPEWARDGAFATVLGRYYHHDELDRRISEWTRDHDHIDLMHRLQESGIASAAVLDQEELFDDPHMLHRGLFEELTQPETGTHMYPGMLWKMARTPNQIRLPSPMLGEHNEWVYKELIGITEAEYAELESAGHVGMDYPPEVR